MSTWWNLCLVNYMLTLKLFINREHYVWICDSINVLLYVIPLFWHTKKVTSIEILSVIQRQFSIAMCTCYSVFRYCHRQIRHLMFKNPMEWFPRYDSWTAHFSSCNMPPIPFFFSPHIHSYMYNLHVFIPSI